MLLRGFLRDEDVNTIILDKGNVELVYDSPEVLEDENYKKLKFKYPDVVEGNTIRSESIPEFELSDNAFFKLTGQNHENYEIDMSDDNKPNIIGRILRRPINVQFYNVMKVYDGNSYIPRERLAYQFLPTDDSSSGLIYGTSKKDNTNHIIGIECISEGKNYSVSDDIKFSCNFNTVDGVNINAVNNFVYDDIRNYMKDYIKIKINSVSKEGEIQSVELDSGNEGLDTVNPIPYNYDNENKIFKLNLYHNTDNYINYKGKNKHEYGYNKVKNLYALKINNSLGVGAEFQITFSPKIIYNNTSNTASESYVMSDFNCLSYGDSLNEDYSTLDPTIQFESKNVTEEIRPLIFQNPKLSGGPLGDVSNCYKLNKVSGYGIILPRLITFDFKTISKVYDGNAEIEITDISYTNVVEGDDIQIDIKRTKFYLDSAEVGIHNIINPNDNEIYLIGEDANNYLIHYTGDINKCKGTITKKDVTVSISYVRFIVYTGKFEICYNIDGVISKDNVYINLSNANIIIGKNKISSVFIDTNSYDISKFTYDKVTGSNEISHLSIKTNNNILLDVYNGMKVSIENFNITGEDSNNYNLMNVEVSEVPLYIIYSR